MSTRTLLDRLDAALASCAARLWSELLDAFALAGQCAGGVRCFPPDRPGADGRPAGRDRDLLQTGERAAALDQPADATTQATHGPGPAVNVAAANGADTLSAGKTARILPHTQASAPNGAFCTEDNRDDDAFHH